MCLSTLVRQTCVRGVRWGVQASHVRSTFFVTMCIFGGYSWYITTISDGTIGVSQHPLPHKGKAAQVANTSSACDICKRILHNPAVNSYCSLKCEEERVHGKPAWLELFYKIIFFSNCSIHQLRRNEMNQYCIDCNLPECRYCVSPSGSCHGHKTLKIYRYVYKDAILASDIAKFIDCSEIQLYKCNKEWVVCKESLSDNTKGAPGTNTSSACAICTRVLHDHELYRYCSLDCKVEAFSRKLRVTDPPFLENGAAAAAEKAAERKKRRKGVPHRAI